MWPIVTLVVVWPVSLSETLVSSAKLVEPTETLFSMWLGWAPPTIIKWDPEEGAVGVRAHSQV